MKKFISFTLLITLFIGLSFVVSSQANAAEYDLTLAHVEPTHSSTHEGALRFKELIEERTNGQVEIHIHPASELGSGPDLAELTQAGSIHLAMLPVGHIGSIFPEIQLFEIPFLFPPDNATVDKIINGSAGELMFTYLEEIDLVGLANFSLSYKHFTANDPIQEPSDFEGLTIRTMPSPIIVESYEILGANPVVIDYHEVYTALQLGTADGQENPYWALGEMGFYEVQDYLTESYHGLFAATFIGNHDWFYSLPEDLQNEIKDVAQEITTLVWQEDEKINSEFREIVHEDPTTEVLTLSDEQREMFREELIPVRDFYIDEVGGHAAELLEAFEEEIKKVR